ncbi:MAG: hypothetical protein KAR06_02835 [Deltaproteobacteria bacterium]|nr:hypothetical protein [Deltaproteobacteria bacterium]
MPFPNYIGGKKRLWTREKVLAGLAAAASQIEGPLPCLDASYSRIKKGRLDWPTASRILEYFGAISRGWLAAGVPKRRVSLHNVPWTEEEREYLFAHAGRKTLETIARRLGRSYYSMRGQLRLIGIASRHNQGFLSAAEISKEFDCCYNRVRRMLKAGEILGRFDTERNRWEVDPLDITPEVLKMLGKPRITHKNWPADRGDYYSRHGLCRRIIGGKTLVVPRGGAALSSPAT